MKALRSEKMSQKTIDFSKRLKYNRLKVDIDEDPLAYHKLWDTIVDYFKENNDRYLELIQQEYAK